MASPKLTVTRRDSILDREARGESVEEIAQAEGLQPWQVRAILESEDPEGDE